MSQQRIPIQNPRTAARVIQGKGVVVVIDQRELHTLNEVGTHIWGLCDGRDVDGIVAGVVQHFAVEESTARADVERFLERLAAVGAITWRSA